MDLRLGARLLARGCRYRVLRHSGRPPRLQALSLEVTHRCVARCEMCNIWRVPAELPELPLDVWLRVLSSPAVADLRELDLTGGEPFLRTDLGELLGAVAEFKARRFPRLRTVAITTNGLLPERTLAGAGQAARALGDQEVELVLAVGLDGLGPVHDRIRGVPGAWETVRTTLDGLLTLREEHPNLILGLKTTVVPRNVGELDDIAVFAERRGLFAIVSPRIVTAGRFGNRDREEALRFAPEEAAAMSRFFRGSRWRWGFHRDAVLAALEGRRVEKPCSAGYNYLFLRSSGEVLPCPLLPSSLGNVAEIPLEKLVQAPALARFRRTVGRRASCGSCTEPGMERFALPFEGFWYLRRRFGRHGREAREMWDRLGLDKYL